MQLTKHHGLANDFLVVLDEVNGRGLTVDGALARRVCDRRQGIGADGLIHGADPDPGQGDDADVVMHLFNADGSRAEMSGNGIRCLAHAVALARDQRELHLCIQTDAGPRAVVVHASDADDRVAQVEAAMGQVGPGPQLPVAVADRLSRPGPAHARRCATADIGNPHLVVEVDEPEAVDLGRDGAWIDQQFADGINVEFVARRSDVVVMRVWERGAGITQACGTGACATASVLQGWSGEAAPGHHEGTGLAAGADPTVIVRMPGGDATVTLLPDGGTVLSGPVHHVATIEVPDA